MIERAEIQFGTTRIPFVIQRSERRATVALAIDHGRLVVTAPVRATVGRLEAIVRGKALWVKQRLQSARTETPLPARELVSGETYRYLGRQYRLRVEPAAGDGERAGEVKLERGWLVVRVAGRSPETVRATLVRWYRRHAEERLPERVDVWAQKLGLAAPRVLVREQQRRWGSCNRAGDVRLNWRIIQAPLSLVDYVIAHELCHLVRHDDGHGAAFWALLGRVMPDYDLRRDRLRALGPSMAW